MPAAAPEVMYAASLRVNSAMRSPRARCNCLEIDEGASGFVHRRDDLRRHE